MKLYKYVAPERMDILEDKNILFTPPRLFNDPFEMRPVFDAVDNPVDAAANWATEAGISQILTSLVKTNYDELTPDQKAITSFEDFIPQFLVSEGMTDEARLKQRARLEAENATAELNSDPVSAAVKLQARLNETVGVLSLSEKNNNLLMWAHYAKSHEGFVIELDEDHQFFHQQHSSQDAFGYAQKVLYSEDRPNFPWLTKIAPEYIYLVKSKTDWKYEQEWRVLRRRSDADGKEITVDGEKVRLFNLPPDCITGIVIGCRMKSKNRKNLTKIFKDNPQYSHVKLQVASMDQKRFALNIDATDVIPSS